MPLTVASRRAALLAATSTPTATPLTSYGKTACTARCSPYFASSATNTACIARNWQISKVPLTKLGITVGNAKINTSTAAEASATGTVAITWQAWVEYPAGVYTQIMTWGGGATDSGAVAFKAIAESDELTLSTPIPANTDFWIWLRATSAAGLLFNNGRNSAKGEVMHTGTSGIELVPSGTVASSGNFSMPPLVIWTSSAITEPAMLIIGDSKNAGFNDRLVMTGGAVGYLQTGEIGRSVADGQHYLDISSGGSRAGGGSNDWTTVWAMRKLILKYFSHHFMCLGYNDTVVDGAAAATVKTRVEAVNTDILAANTYGRITHPTLGPGATSAGGGFVSLADQSARQNAIRIAHNANVRTGAITGNNNGYIEIANLLDADPVDNAANNGKWAMAPVLRSITDATILIGTPTTLTSVTASFTAADVGVGVSVFGAGAAGGVLVTWISSVTNGTTVVLFGAAGTGVAGVNATIGVPCDSQGLHETAYGYLIPFNNGIPAAILLKLAA